MASIAVFLLLSLGYSALGDNGEVNAYARLVYNVRGLQDYEPHWNGRYPPGSTVMIYTESEGVNHEGAVAVDYIFIVRNPEGHLVDAAFYGNRILNFTDNDFVVYEKTIPDSWMDGLYSVEIHVFDLLNDTLMENFYIDVASNFTNVGPTFVNKSETDLETDYESGTEVPPLTRSIVKWDPLIEDLPLINRTDARNKTIYKNFYVDRHSSRYPPDWFKIENLILDKTVVAPRVPVRASVSVVNAFSEAGSTNISFLLDDEVIGERQIDLGPHQRVVATITLVSETPGRHVVEAVPIGSNTVGVNLTAEFTVNPEEEVMIPTKFVIKDLQIDSITTSPGRPVNITVTVLNEGKEGTEPVSIYINGKLEQEKHVSLGLNEKRDVVFSVTKNEIGTYKVTVPDTSFTKLFFVESPPENLSIPGAAGKPEKKKRPEVFYISLASTLVILFYLARMYLERKLEEGVV